MNVLIDVRDDLVRELKNLSPGSDEQLKLAQVIKTISDVDINERKFEFEVDKEETRKLERSYDVELAEINRKLRWIELGIDVLNALANPVASLKRTSMNNKVKILRDEMGYHFEEHGVVGSHTLTNAQKDRYD